MPGSQRTLHLLQKQKQDLDKCLPHWCFNGWSSETGAMGQDTACRTQIRLPYASWLGTWVLNSTHCVLHGFKILIFLFDIFSSFPCDYPKDRVNLLNFLNYKRMQSISS